MFSHPGTWQVPFIWHVCAWSCITDHRLAHRGHCFASWCFLMWSNCHLTCSTKYMRNNKMKEQQKIWLKKNSLWESIPPPPKPGSRHVFENYNDNYNLLASHRCFSNISVTVLLSNIQCSRRILFFLNPGQVSIIPLYTPDGCQVVFSTGWSRGQLFSSFEKR